MANHNLPTLASTYANFVSELDGRLKDIARGFDPATTAPTNVPTSAMRFNGSAAKWEKWNGTAWADPVPAYAVSITGNAGSVTNGLYATGAYSNPSWITSLAGTKISGNIAGNAGSATILQTARLINGVSFSGSNDISINVNNSVTFNNTGAGAASGTTFNGSAARTISYNTVGAPSTTGTGASGTWGISITGSASSALSISNTAEQQLLNKIYPVGSIYTNATNSSNPATLLGFGSWVAFGQGRVPVGFDGGDALFNAAEKTGGSKDATLVSHSHEVSGTTGAGGAHTHGIQSTGGLSNSNADPFQGLLRRSITDGYSTGQGTNPVIQNTGDHAHAFSATSSSAGSSATNANMQPYITVYMWKRTA